MSHLFSKIVVSIACLAVGVGLSLVIDIDGSRATASEIRTITDRYHQAMIDRNEEILDSVLSERLKVVTRFENSLLSKNDVVKRYRSLPGKLNSVEISHVRIDIDESNATLECFAKMLLISEESGPISHEAVYLYGFERIDGEWKISSIHQR